MLVCKPSALLESPNNLVGIGKIVDRVPAVGVSLEGQNLAVDPKATDTVVDAELE